jgi:micrococcal nuclease
MGVRACALALGICLVGGACEPETPAEKARDAASATTLPGPASTEVSAEEHSSDGSAIAVRSVTDGDTLVVADGRRVRLAQVDAPETNECFGAASTQALRDLVEGHAVELRRTSGPTTDRYGRTLADVLVEGRSVNEALVRAGAAEWYEQFGHEDVELAARLESAEKVARQAARGLWSECHATAAASPASVPLTTAPPSTSAPAATGSTDCHPAYPDDCIPPAPPDLDCPDIARRVRVDHAHGDPHRFDADGDGAGCEAYG